MSVSLEDEEEKRKNGNRKYGIYFPLVLFFYFTNKSPTYICKIQLLIKSPDPWLARMKVFFFVVKITVNSSTKMQYFKFTVHMQYIYEHIVAMLISTYASVGLIASSESDCAPIMRRD